MNKRQAWSLGLAAAILAALACVYGVEAASLRTGKPSEAAFSAPVPFAGESQREAEVQKLGRRTDAEWREYLRGLDRIDGCTVSHYCCELRPHICGTGSGITASGEPVQAGVSVAVDPLVIPLGSTVYVDYGDGEIHTYTAHDTGGAVNGGHIDVAVETHEEALRRGMRTATVWWEEQR